MMNETRDGKHTDEVTRRRVLGVLVGAGSALALGCGTTSLENDASTGAAGGGAAGSGAAGTSGADAGADGGACAVTPEGEIGPYFADDSDARFNRSDILTNIDGTSAQTGLPLTLTITVLDGQKSCAAYAGAQVDIWHCNAAGVYSDQAAENTSSESWLRGYQLTDASGQVKFVTIIPGWYSGRTTHVHLRVRSTYSAASSTSDGTNTTQLFFAQTFIDMLATSVSPYSAEGTNPTTNASDHVYSGETNGANQLSLSGDAATGYTAAVSIVLPITAAATSTTGTTTGTTTGGPGAGMP